MTAMPAPTPSTNQPITLPARRTTSAPSVAYRIAAGAVARLEIVVTRGSDVRTVSTAPASATSATAHHATAVAHREWVTGAPPDPAPFSRPPRRLPPPPWLLPPP